MFYLRYHDGHTGRYGNEFFEFEFKDNVLRYANCSNYKQDQVIEKQVVLSKIVLDQVLKMIHDSKIMEQNDHNWPKPKDDKQELEINHNGHVSFVTKKINSSLDLKVDGLQKFHYFVLDLKCLVLSLISLHFKVNPIK